MARIVKDRVKDTSTTTGTGTITLANSPPNGFQAFSVLGDGSTTFYCIEDANGIAFEVGVGTYTGNTLARTTILESSNSGNAISLTSGTHTVFVTYPSNRSTFNDEGLSPTFTASGTITAGKAVIQNTNGTVTQVGTTTIASGIGTLSTNTVSNAEEGQVAMGATNQFVNLYRVANSTLQYLTANTISSTDLKTITRGSTVNFDSGKERNAGIIYEPNQDKYVVIAKNGNDYLTATTVTFSGTGSTATLTLGTQTIIDSNVWSGSGFQNANITYDTTAQKIVVAGTKSGTNGAICIVINLDGTTFVSGSRTTVPLSSTSLYASDNVICSYSSTANKVVFLHCENSQSDSTAINYTNVGTVSGTSISFGSAQAVGSPVDSGYSNMSKDTTLSVDNNGVIVITYLSQSYTLYSQAATLSGTTLTWGSTSQISNITVLNGAFGECGSVKIADGKTIIVRATTSGSASNADKGIFCVITVSGTSVTNGSVQEFSSSATRYPNVSSNYSKTQALINFGYGSENNIIFQESSQEGSSNLNSTNFFGIASNSATTTNPVQINVLGSINNAQTGLTVDKDYYAKDDGSIVERQTTATTNNTFPSFYSIENTNINPQTSESRIIYDTTNDKVWFATRDQSNSNYPVVAVGDASSGTSITWGTKVVVDSNSRYLGDTNQHNMAFGNGKVFFTYRDSSSDYLYARILEYSGTNSATVGSATQVNSVACAGWSVCYDSTSDKFVVFQIKNDASKTVGTVMSYSGSSLTAYTPVVADTASNNQYYGNIFQIGTKIVFNYRDTDDDFTIRTGSISGTTLTFDAVNVLTGQQGNSSGSGLLTYDSENDKILYLNSNMQSTGYIYARIITLSGTTFTFGAETLMNSDKSTYLSSYWDAYADRFVVGYQVSASPYATKNGSITVSGTTPTWVDGIDMPNATDASYLTGSVYVPDINKGMFVTRLASAPQTTLINYFGTTTTTTINASQFVGTALSATALELKTFPASTIVGRANGSITEGKPVIVRTDGDFEQVAGTSSSGGVVSPETQQVSTSPATEDKFYIANNGSGTIGVISLSSSAGVQFVLGTDDGTSITWGTPVTVNSNSYFRGASVYYDPDEDKFICSYVGNANLDEIRSRIISYSGTTATLSTESSALTKGNISIYMLSSDYDTTNNKGYVCVGKELGKMFTVTVSGSTITQSALSSQFSGASNSMQFGQMVYDNTNSVGYIVYRNEAISDYPYIQTYTVSGDTFTFGTETAIESLATTGFVGVAEGSADGKGVCVAYKNSGTIIKYVTPTFSGLTPTIGSVTTLSGGQVPGTSLYWEGAQVVNYNPVSQTFILAYQDTNAKFDIVTNSGSVSGGTLTFGNYDVVYPTTNSSQYYAISGPTGKDANNAFIIQQRYNQSPYKIAGSIWGDAYNVSTVNLTAKNYIGIAQETISTGNDVKVTTISGVDANQSSLTPAELYYVQTDGTLSTTAGSPSVVAGLATSATTLLITRS